MSQFVIILNNLDGVDLILKALSERHNERGCVASGDLHEGILNKLYMLEDGKLTLVSLPGNEPIPEPMKKVPHLSIIPKLH